LPNDSIVVARFAGAGLAERDRDAAAWEAEVFLVGARFVPVALPAGAVAPDDLAAVAAFFAATFRGGGPPLSAPVRLLARAACAIVAPCRICRWRRVFPAPRRSNAGFTLPWWRTR
jgi:hypothetical protein